MIIPAVSFDSAALQLSPCHDLATSFTPEATLSEVLVKYDVCGLTYLWDVAAAPHLTHLQQICAKHRVVVSLGSHLGLVEEVLNSGARMVAITADSTSSEFLSQFPKERLVLEFTLPSGDLQEAALQEVSTKIRENHSRAHGAIVHFPRRSEVPLAMIEKIKIAIPKDSFLAVSGGISTEEDIRILDKAGVQALVGAALANCSLDLGLAIAAPLISDRADGLFATVVADEHGIALGLVYSSRESISQAVKAMRGVYHSRKKGLWFKGESSGATQDLIRIELDCDKDALRFVVHQNGVGFCHLETWTCFGKGSGFTDLMSTLKARKASAPPGSYTQRLFQDPALLRAKLLEEAGELSEATEKDHVAQEAADVIYLALVKCASVGVSLAEVQDVLDQRSLKVKRRPGDAKPGKLEEAQQALKKQKIDHPPTPTTTPTPTKIKMQCYKRSEVGPEKYKQLLLRPLIQSDDIMGRIQPIKEAVQAKGDAALLEYTEKFDKVKLSCPVVTLPLKEKLKIDPKTTAAIDLAMANVTKFHEAQVSAPLEVETTPGVTCSRFSRPIERVGLYVPGGSAVLPSTAYMLGIPAKVAGCKEIIFASPPRRDGSVCPEVLYVAEKLGVTKVLVAGGAQAIFAMAYGTESVPKVDKICGPGNQFVTAAKMMVQNDSSAMVSIDMPAGPSELLVVAQETSNPAYVASDLLSQAEHGPDSQVVLVAVSLTDAKLQQIEAEIEQQGERLPRSAIVRQSIPKSFIFRVDTMEEALEFSNAYAPEHLILGFEDSEKYLPKVLNAGSVFLGPYSSESCGDYASGTNHTLPTYGYARMYSGVNTATFVKHITSQKVTRQGLDNIGDAVTTLAAVEELEAHRNAVAIRLLDIRKM